MSHRESIIKKAAISLLEKEEHEAFFTLIEVTPREESFQTCSDEEYNILNLQKDSARLAPEEG